MPLQRSRLAIDYVLLVGTGVLFLLYLPLFAAVPRLAAQELIEADLLWLLPLVLISACLVALCIWAVQGGVTVVGRVLWTLVLTFAAAGCLAGYMAAMMALPAPKRHYAQPRPADPPPVPIEPMDLP